MKITTATWMFLDTETTGLKPEEGAQIIELGWVTIKNMRIVANQDELINPGKPIPPFITKLTHISDQDVAGKPTFEGVASKFMAQFQAAEFIAAYNKDFDRKMLEVEFERVGLKLPEKEWLDPLTWARGFMQNADNKLTTVAQKFNVSLENAHRADADAAAAAEVLIKFFDWGVDEAAFPDDVEAMKEIEHGIFRNQRATANIMNPLKQNVVDPKTGEKRRKVVMTGTPGQVAQNVYDNYNRERLFKMMKAGRWGK